MDSNQPVNVYISAASDLMAEREMLAQMIARLPVTLAWRILQSPLANEGLDLTALQGVDLHFLLMGMDIRAPIGLEWQLAHYAGRQTIPFLKQGVARTMAGQSFIRETRLSWQPFADVADLHRQARHRLINHLLSQQHRYALRPVELEQLHSLQAEAQAESPVVSEAGLEGEHQAAQSAVILSRERYQPSQGILIDDGPAEGSPPANPPQTGGWA